MVICARHYAKDFTCIILLSLQSKTEPGTVFIFAYKFFVGYIICKYFLPVYSWFFNLFIISSVKQSLIFLID